MAGQVLPLACLLAVAALAFMGSLTVANTRQSAACWLVVLSSALALVYIVILRPKKQPEQKSGALV